MLGFDALGALALGGAPDPASGVSYTLTASAASFALTGQAIPFRIGEDADAGAFTLTGQAAFGIVKLAPAAGSFTLNGQAIVFPIRYAADTGGCALGGQSAGFKTAMLSGVGAFTNSGQAANFAVAWRADAGSLTITGLAALFAGVMPSAGGAFADAFQDAALTRTGDDYDQVYGGIGHYLEELQRLKQLAAITRRAPPPLMRAVRPRPSPVSSQPPQRGDDTQAVVADALALQRAAMRQQVEEQAHVALAKRRREEAEVLMLVA